MTPSEEEITVRLKSHIDDGDFPGAVVAIAKHGQIQRLVAAGYANLTPHVVMHEETIFDVASLTKPLITATAILLLVQNGKVSLDSSLEYIFESCPNDKAGITVADLLSHRSGMEAWYPLYAHGRSISEYCKFILRHPLAAQPRTEAIYSDLNFILLSGILEKLTGSSFTAWVNTMILNPLGLQRSYLAHVPFPLEEVAATELGGVYEGSMAVKSGVSPLERTALIHGETHDGNSWAAGGCAGNAGLFSTARELIILAEEYGVRSKLLSSQIRDHVGENMTPFSATHRTIGWQLASSDSSSAGPAISANAIGHNGFTGTSIWFDRDQDITIVILTNRIHPHYTDVNMNEIRRRLHTFFILGAK